LGLGIDISRSMIVEQSIDIYLQRCKGCGLCVEFCPKHIIELSPDLNSIGYHPASLMDAEKCTACALCALMCPEGGISVYRKRRKAHD
jgi:2-oxoglutarate ferredoxin oxidoreductase subunit delta